MKKIVVALFVVISALSAISQPAQIAAELSSQNSYELSILGIKPDSFPIVSVAFQARNAEGRPLWELPASEFTITENGSNCPIVGITSLTADKPLDIALVFDHSGSMAKDPSLMQDSAAFFTFMLTGKLPPNYVMPITRAADAVVHFLEQPGAPGDAILFVGFNHEVDPIGAWKPSNKVSKEQVRALEPGGGTAFYDALIAALETFDGRSSLPAIIALTDGIDENSTHTWEDAVSKAQELEVPLYIVGLGGANSELLEKMATQTNGYYYYTSDAAALTTIYGNIKKQLRSLYEISYSSVSLDSINPVRDLVFGFVNDTLEFANPEVRMELPQAALDYIAAAELARKRQAAADARAEAEAAATQRNRLLMGGAAVVLLLGAAAFVVKRSKSTSEKPKSTPPVLQKAWPNPFRTNLNVNFELGTESTATLVLIDAQTRQQHTMQVAAGQQTASVEVSALPAGNYIVQLRNAAGASNLLRVVKA